MRRITEKQANTAGLIIAALLLIYFGPMSIGHIDPDGPTWRGLIALLITLIGAVGSVLIFIAWAVDGGWGRLVTHVWNRLLTDEEGKQ